VQHHARTGSTGAATKQIQQAGKGGWRQQTHRIVLLRGAEQTLAVGNGRCAEDAPLQSLALIVHSTIIYSHPNRQQHSPQEPILCF
jgi:hypothetical protein